MPDCNVKGTFNEQDSMDNSSTCPGVRQPASPRITGCQGGADYTYGCPQTVSPFALGARFSTDDQIDNPGRVFGATIRAVE